MKALPKKRKDQLQLSSSVHFSESSLAKQKLFFYSISIVVYGWFMFWIAYDIFVWHKPLLEGNIINYIGASTSVAFIWAEAKLLKNKQAKKKSYSPIQLEQAKPQKTPQLQKPQPKPSQNPLHHEKPLPSQTHTQPTHQTTHKTPKQTHTTNTCIHHKQQPKNPQNPDQIPDECLTCTNLIQCLNNKTQLTN